MVLRRTKRAAGVWLCATLAVAMAFVCACGKNKTPPEPPTTDAPTLAFTQTEIAVERYAQRTLSLSGSGRADAVFTSDNTAVAAVSASGVVTAVSEGEATVAATADGATVTVRVTVKRNGSYPVLQAGNESITIAVGTPYTLTPTLQYNGSPLETDFTFTASEGLTVSASGVLTASTAGDYVCTVSSAYAGELFAREISVRAVRENYFYLDTAACTLYASDLFGDGLSTSATVSAVTDCADPIAYTSGDNTVATVSQTGVVTAVGAGQTRITVTCGDYVEHVSVAVEKPRTELAARDVEKPKGATPVTIDLSDLAGQSEEDSAVVTTADGRTVAVESFEDGSLALRSGSVPLGENVLTIETSSAVIVAPVTVATALVSDKAQFQAIATAYQGGYSSPPASQISGGKPDRYRDGYFVLTADIDMQGDTFGIMDPNSADATVFDKYGSVNSRPQVGWYGVLDGRGHVVKNIRSGRRGLFANIEKESAVKNVAFVSGHMGAADKHNQWSCGGFLCESMVGTVDNVLIEIDGIPDHALNDRDEKTGLWGIAGICYSLYGEISNTVIALTEPQFRPTQNGLNAPNVIADCIKGNPVEVGVKTHLRNSFGLVNGENAPEGAERLRAVGAMENGNADAYRVADSFAALTSLIGSGFSDFWQFTDASITFGTYTFAWNR